jgi:hypothetical protein
MSPTSCQTAPPRASIISDQFKRANCVYSLGQQAGGAQTLHNKITFMEWL